MNSPAYVPSTTETLAAYSEAKSALAELSATYLGLTLAEQRKANLAGAGHLLILRLYDRVEFETYLTEFCAITKLNKMAVRKTVEQRASETVAGCAEVAGTNGKRRSAPSNNGSGASIWIAPSGAVSITESATEIFKRIGPTHNLFMRGGVPMRSVTDKAGALTLEEMRPSAFRSEVELHAQVMAWRAGEEGEPVLKRVILAEDMAKALLDSGAARDHLPRISGLLNCPILHGDGEILGPGYHAKTEMLITGGTLPPDVELSEAVASLKELVEEYDFQTPGDRARALASIITPALKIGGHLHGNVPADVAEADQSQAGKGYRQRVTAAVYNERVALVTQRSGGVGSMDESFNAKLIEGRAFIALDNLRNKQDSPHIEAFLTAERTFPARTPHRREVEIDPSRFFLFLTSNGVESTRDFANRSSIIRIKKRGGFTFRRYPDGDLLDHVRARQPYFLGCVFSVVREWIAQGRQRTNEVRHDFREWCQVLDWVVQNILHEAPLMDGHQSAQERVSNPDLTFMRALTLAVVDQARLGESLIASALYEIAETAGVDIPRLKEPNEEAGKRQIGIIMGRLFKTTDTLDIEGFTVTRHEVETDREGGGSYVSKSYTFTSQEAESAQPAQDAKCSGKPRCFPRSIESCASCAPVQTEPAATTEGVPSELL